MVQPEFRISTLNVGDLVDGRYQVQGHLGSGGMGDVWLVQHRELVQHFALKTLKPELHHSSERLQRFLREARAAAALHSRYIVRVVDGRTDYLHHGEPLPFIVMEYLKGVSVEERVTLYGPCSPPEASWLLGRLGLALRAAHSGGLVHRDVKPANLFIADGEDGEPTVKLGDFGIVKLMDEALLADSAMTASGMLLGTPMYMAPEQLRGKRAIGHHADQWSFAMVAFYVLAGCSYFEDAESMADLIASALSLRLSRPSQKSSRFPSALDAWFLRSCSQAPEERFRDVAEQVREFDRLLGEPKPVPIWPHRASSPAQGNAPRGQTPVSWWALALGIVAAGTVMVWAWLNQEGAAALLFPAARSQMVAAPQTVTPWLPVAASARGTAPQLAALPPKAPAAAASAGEAPAVGASPYQEPALVSFPWAVDARDPQTQKSAQQSAQKRHTVSVRARSSSTSTNQPSQASATVKPSGQAIPKEPSRRRSGASCTRSAECQSGLCVAEACR